MKMLLKLYAIVFATMLLTACGEDEYVYPDLITEMTCLKTDAQGFGVQIITDEGTVWHLKEGNRPDSLTADSTYRVVSRYAPLTTADASKAEAAIYSLYKVTASIPQTEEKYEEVLTDPVSIQSIWRSGDYLNMILLIKVKDRTHELSFVENGITLQADGTRTLTLTLYHDRKNDVEGFDEKHYLSVPLWHYDGKLNKGDQIVFQLNTYKEGMTSRTFTY